MTVIMYGPGPIDDPTRPSRGPDDPFGIDDIFKPTGLTPCVGCKRHIRIGDVCPWCTPIVRREEAPVTEPLHVDEHLEALRTRLAWLVAEIAKRDVYVAEADRIRRMLTAGSPTVFAEVTP